MNRRVALSACMVALVVAVSTWTWSRSDHTITVTADFSATIGLYPGDDVRVVGVPVGKITTIRPQGGHVEVVMSLDAPVPVAADTGAVIVPPGLLASRYIELTKPWNGGPRLGAGAHLDTSHTAAPMELDDVTAELDKFLAALGPNGANRQGALSDLVAASERALHGNGTTLRQSLSDLAAALDTLGQSRGDIIGTIQQLHTFVAALAGSDSAVRSLEHNMAAVTSDLGHQRVQLAATIRGLATTTRAVQTFVRRNRSLVSSDVGDLARITTTLKDRQRELMEISDLVPVGLESIFGTADLSTRTLDTRVDLTPLLAHPDTTLCQIFEGAGLPQLCPKSVPGAGGGSR